MTSVGHTIVVGAGPAGLTAAYELLEAGHRSIEVLDGNAQVGGLSKTVVHHGNRIDIGGHRFFSKSDWVMRWWLDKLPIATGDRATLAAGTDHAFLAYQGMRRKLPLVAPDAGDGATDATMLVRDRRSRILFGGKLFAYPLKLDVATMWKLGPLSCAMYAASYIAARIAPVRPEATLEDFFINRFGRLLYQRFFKTYTEKVWGRSCREISAAWGAQRVKGLSISRAIVHALRQLFSSRHAAKETSLIEHFLYPRLGPGADVGDGRRPHRVGRRAAPAVHPRDRDAARRAPHRGGRDRGRRDGPAHLASGRRGRLDDADPRPGRGARRRRAEARARGRRGARVSRLHDGGPAVPEARP